MSFHVRRKEREITDKEEMKQVLKSTKYVTVALCMNNAPYLVALNHGYDQTQNCLYFHCAPKGKKIIYAQANPSVWGQAVLDFGVTDECDYAYTSVHFQGKLRLITNFTEKKHAMETLVRQVALHPNSSSQKSNLKKSARPLLEKSISLTCQARSIRHQKLKEKIRRLSSCHD